MVIVEGCTSTNPPPNLRRTDETHRWNKIPFNAIHRGAKQDLVEEEEVAAAEIEDTTGNGDGNDTLGVNGEGEGEKSESDEEDNEEDEDPSLCMHAPPTDRKKQKDFEIFVGGLDKEAVEEDLIKVFGKFGEIQTARIVRHPTTLKSKGFAFIRYASVEQAKNALSELKDGTEVRGKRVGISPSQDNGTLYIGNICKAWTKEHVLETLRSFGIEQIEEMRLPDDPKNEGKIKGFAFLEFSTHSDAMVAFQRLRKSDVVFGRDRSAKVAFAQTPLHPSEEALSQVWNIPSLFDVSYLVKTVYIEGLTDSWDEVKVKELCEQYGEIEKVQLSRNLVNKRKDFGFIVFKSREIAVACVEGINTAQIGEGDIKVKANLAKPQNKGRLQKQGARGGFKVMEGEVTDEAGPSKLKGHAKSKGAKGKGKVLSKLRSAKGGKPYKPQHIVTEGQGTGAPSSSERTNHQRKERPAKGGKRGRRDTDTGYNMQSSKKPRGNMRSRPSEGFGNQRNNSRFGMANRNYGAASATHGNPYAQGYAPTSSYQGHAYGAVSGSKRHYSDMEPHAGYLEHATGNQGQAPYGYGLRSAGRYDGQGSSGAAYGGGNI
ncbi:hypothetical protein HHK36_027921 [Tetracentron sinense]|uniref:RRM domain-containing protein n=1 Tax=Tetracentron sinense TaxID=13715 RepID=A0A834YFN6_TETSI|nr:hypothetical protein HHK36_027921 [Tetracentron sinense]